MIKFNADSYVGGRHFGSALFELFQFSTHFSLMISNVTNGRLPPINSIFVMTIQQARRVVPPTVDDMMKLIHSAQRVYNNNTEDHVPSTSSVASSSSSPTLPTFHPGVLFPSSRLGLLLDALGFHVLATQPLDEVIHTLQEATTVAPALQRSTTIIMKGGGVGLSLRVLYDWLPTLSRLDNQVPGATPCTSFMSDIEFSLFQKKLPTGRTAEAQKKRAELFLAFDPNGNGFLSLAEIDKGARDILQLNALFDCKPVLMRAFQAARKSDPPSAANHQGDYVTKRTFRLLLWYLKEYFNLWQLFVRADESGDRRVSKDEFVAILPQLVERGLVTRDEAANADALFVEADLDGAGMLLFEEFSSWALARGAKLVDGDE